MITEALSASHSLIKLERAALALLQYIEESSEGFRILVRDSHAASGTGTFASLISEIASQVEDVLADEFAARGYDPKLAPMYAQMLVGMVALTGQWWLDVRKPGREEVAAHLVNLAWNGLTGLNANPTITAVSRELFPSPAKPRAGEKELREFEKARREGGQGGGEDPPARTQRGRKGPGARAEGARAALERGGESARARGEDPPAGGAAGRARRPS